MKKTLYALAPALLLFCGSAIAQQDKKKVEKKVDKKEIIIEEKASGKTEKMVIVIDGDNVTINGKPAENYKGKKHIVIDDDIIINGNSVRVPRQGRVYMQNLDAYSSNRAVLGVVTSEDDKGAKVNEVIKESAAEKAGLKEGDVITKVNDAKIEGHNDLVKVIGKMKPDDAADVTFLRDGKEKKVKATLGKSKAPRVLSWNSNGNQDFNFDYHMSPPMAMTIPRNGRAFGFNDNDMWVFRSDRPKYGMSIEDNADGDGVKINSVEEESNAAKAGLKENDIITEVEGSPVKGVDALREALLNSKDKTTISMKVLRSGSPVNVTVRVPKVIHKADL